VPPAAGTAARTKVPVESVAVTLPVPRTVVVPVITALVIAVLKPASSTAAPNFAVYSKPL
jgi:hypothetical protein